MEINPFTERKSITNVASPMTSDVIRPATESLTSLDLRNNQYHDLMSPSQRDPDITTVATPTITT